MPKICKYKTDNYDCQYKAFSKGYCRMHQWKKPGYVKKIKPISDRRNIEGKTYKQLRIEYMSSHENCECGCGKKSRDLHHKAGRVGSNYTDIDTFMAVCRECHTWIHNHPKTAREKGWLI